MTQTLWGHRLARADGLAKVTGADVFGADDAPEDALWLRPIRSPYLHAKFTLGDLDGFIKQNPGLEAILTAKDVPGYNGFGIFPNLRNQPVFADGLVRYRGDVAIALVGERNVVSRLQGGRPPDHLAAIAGPQHD